VAGTGGVLVGADHAAVDVVDQPVELPTGISAAVDLRQQPLEHPITPPTVEAAGDRLPGAILAGEVPPGSAGAGQPDHGLHDLAVIVVGPAGGWPLGWQQGFQGRPLVIGKFRFGAGHAPNLSTLEPR